MRNHIRQKAGEIEAFKALEVGALKWCKEHVPRDGNDWTEGQMLLDDPELWLDRLTFLWECHASRKRDRTKALSVSTTKKVSLQSGLN